MMEPSDYRIDTRDAEKRINVTHISVERRSHDWMAYINHDTRLWHCAPTPEEAVRKVLNTHTKEAV